jgi:phosphatidylserine/phosphatidylglycerophosphate/cardiolipin synthase-like enzyme
VNRDHRSNANWIISLGLAAAAILVVAILWALRSYYGQELGLFEEEGGSPGSSGPVIRNPGASDWYWLFFTAPREQPRWTGGLDEVLAADIDGASSTVDLAVFDLDLQTVTDALVRAHGRGIRVRLVIESDNLGLDQPQDLLAAGIPIVDDNRSALMHDKFVIIDGLVTWTGSWNLTEGGTYRNNNHAVRIRSREMAANYTAEFEEMFLDGRFGPSSPSGTPYPHLMVDGTLIETYFAPEDGVMEQVIQAVSRAEHSIRFMAFSFTDAALGRAIRERAAAGVLAEGVFESRGASSDYSQFTALKEAGLPVWRDANPALMHHKVIVIDAQTVILGSFNFTASADQGNDENLLVIQDPDLAGQFLGEFARLITQAYP